MLTNSSREKPGPKEVSAGIIFTFAHQAYFGFQFLSRNREPLWIKLLLAKQIREIQELGKECVKPNIMAGAGYGAKGLMTWLTKQNVAIQILAAKNHRRYPRSRRPSSRDRRMLFLAIAVAAGVFDRKFSTTLRKLAEAGYGERYLSQRVHNWDRIEQQLKERGVVWAEPILNYCDPMPVGGWQLKEDLPCSVPKDCYHGGYIIHGFLADGRVASRFSRTLPTELRDVTNPKKEKAENVNKPNKKCRIRDSN